MSNSAYGTIATNGNTFVLSTSDGSRPAKTPPGLIATNAVQTQGGWLGQVIVDKVIVFETAGCSNADDAIDAANQRVVDVIRSLFEAPAPAVVVTNDLA
jgi:hypothetical protein